MTFQIQKNVPPSLAMVKKILCTSDHESIPEIIDLLAQPGSNMPFSLMSDVIALEDRALACSALKNILAARPGWINHQGNDDCTLLISAVKNIHLDVVDILLDMGAQADITDTHGLNALDYAARLQGSQSVRGKISDSLLGTGHFSAEQKDIALYYAASNGNLEAVSGLINEGAGFSKTIRNSTALSAVCRLREDTHPVVDILRVMLATERGRKAIDVVTQNGGYTHTKPLCSAAFVGNIGALTVLLEAGAPINPPQPPSVLQCQTPLMEAASGQQPEAIALLLKAGANPNYVNWDGNTALHQLALSEWDFDEALEIEPKLIKSLDLLLAAGADLSIKDDDDLTPQEVARSHNLHTLADRMAAAISAQELAQSTDVVCETCPSRVPGPRL